MFKRFLLATAAVMLLASPAMASSCPKHMKAIDAALAKSPKMDAKQMGEVKELRATGEAMHKAGKHKESMDALAKAEKMLGIGK